MDSSRAPAVEESAADIMKAGVKTRDALHIACAIEAGPSSYRGWPRSFAKQNSTHFWLGLCIRQIFDTFIDKIAVCDPIWFLDFSEDGKGNGDSAGTPRGS